MASKDEILACFEGSRGERAAYLPDLTLWHKWHRRRGTLPAGWQDYSLAQSAAALGSPAWVVVRPWQVVQPGIEIVTEEGAAERLITYHTAAGDLRERWTLGPDGDWWQVEYPVKSEEDLPAAREVVLSRHYNIDEDVVASLSAGAGPATIIALEIPMRPYSDLLHTMLGWGDGLMFFRGEGRPLLMEMMASLETRLQTLAQAVADFPCAIVLAPDNLDGQYISPRGYREYLAASYRATGENLHAHGKRLIVHAGGPVGRLLPLLAESGVDGVEGVAARPQGDLSLAEARQTAGPDLTLWGGIPQDYLLATLSHEEFEAAVLAAARQAAGEGRIILGVADRVPVDAVFERLQAIPGLIDRACAG